MSSMKKECKKWLAEQKEKEVVTAQDIFKEIAQLYSKLGDKLWEFERLMNKKVRFPNITGDEE